MFEKLIDILLYVPRIIFSAFVDALIFLFNAIPVPEFIQNLNFSGLDASAYFLDAISFSYGIAIVLSALIARFLLRRIPLIG